MVNARHHASRVLHWLVVHVLAGIVQASTWSACSDPCSLSSRASSYKSRTVQCVTVSPSGTASVVSSSQCVGRDLVSPPSVMECDPEPCLGVFWLAVNDWGPCSSLCITNASDSASLGVSTRSAPRCVRAVNGTTQAVTETLCGPQTMVGCMCSAT
jgi:hypothetical protein